LQYADDLAEAGRHGKAAKAYLALVHEWHASDEAPAAQRGLARQREQQGRLQKAFKEYQYLIDNFPGGFSYEQVIDRQFRIATALMTRPRGRVRRFLGYTASEEALPLFEQIVANAPSWKRAPEAQFNVALLHEQAGEYEEAMTAYERIPSRYPKSGLVAAARYRRAHCLVMQARKDRRDENACRHAMTALAGFIRDYPVDPNVPEARRQLDALRARLAASYFERAEFYDRRQKVRAAHIAYHDFLRQFPSSDLAPRARARVKALNPLLEADDE
jgi:outer membrane assembly lipoprotein YfiO